MNILTSYANGIKEATLRPKMVFVLWLINLIFGSVIYFLSINLLSNVAGKSVIADKLLREFDFNFLFDLIVHHGQSLYMIFLAAFILILIYFLVSVFLNGGILFRLLHPRKLSDDKRKINFAQDFFQGGGKFFGRFFRLEIYSLILWIAVVIFIFLLNKLIQIVTGEGSHEQLSFYLFWIQLAIGLFLFFLIRMILDYVRIRIVTENSRRVFLALFQTIKFVFQKFFNTLALYYLLLLTAIILCGSYFVLSSLIPVYSLVTILVVFIVRQVFIVSRGWLKVAVLAAQLRFYLSSGSVIKQDSKTS